MIVPPVKDDLKLMSIGFFLDDNAPVMWRGPMLHRALEQFLSDVHWGELDTLVVDMPPGTGDVSISLGQLLPRAEVVIVTTPQPLAQEVAARAAIDGAEDEHAPDRRDREHDLGGVRHRRRRAARRARSACRCSARCRSIRPAARVRRRGRAARLGRARLGDGAGDRLDRRGNPRGAADVQGAARPLLSDAPERLRALGFSEADAATLADHFLDAERRGKPSHGLSRVDWLAALPGLDPSARPERVASEPGYERWDGSGALGYLTLAAICDAQLADPPAHARVVVASRCFPTGRARLLGAAARRRGPGAALTATSPLRLASPDGGPPLAGTNPIAIGVPSSDGRPLVADVSMGRVTHGDVLTGDAAEELVPFGGDRAHKAFALAVGVQMLVGALAGEEPGAVLVVARPEFDPVPGLRALAAGARLPGDR